VQKATAKTTDLAKTAAAKAPDLAKTAAPKIVDAAKQAGQQAADRLPFTGGKDGDAEAPSGEAGSTDGRVPYEADGSPASFDGMR
jgi:hypothetical protein